jgi:hypothetical protein
MHKPETKTEWQKFLRERDEFLRQVYYQDLRELTNEESLRRLRSLKPVGEPWRQNPQWSGLIEQQEIFHRRRKG